MVSGPTPRFSCLVFPFSLRVSSERISPRRVMRARSLSLSLSLSCLAMKIEIHIGERVVNESDKTGARSFTAAAAPLSDGQNSPREKASLVISFAYRRAAARSPVKHAHPRLLLYYIHTDIRVYKCAHTSFEMFAFFLLKRPSVNDPAVSVPG